MLWNQSCGAIARPHQSIPGAAFDLRSGDSSHWVLSGIPGNARKSLLQNALSSKGTSKLVLQRPGGPYDRESAGMAPISHFRGTRTLIMEDMKNLL